MATETPPPEGAARWRDEAFRIYCAWRGYAPPAESGITIGDLATEHQDLVARLAAFAEAQYRAGLAALEPYANHLGDCEAALIEAAFAHLPQPCLCGLAAALRGEPPEAEGTP